VSETGPPSIDPGDAWRYALVGGLASIPFTALSYLETGSELSLSPVLFGGLLAGYLARRRTGSLDGVGIRAGLVGGLPALAVLAEIVAASSALGGPAWFVVAGSLLTLGFVVTVAILAFGLSAVLGAVGARIGGWLARSSGGGRAEASV
jgi:hypothetical protein